MGCQTCVCVVRQQQQKKRSSECFFDIKASNGRWGRVLSPLKVLEIQMLTYLSMRVIKPRALFFHIIAAIHQFWHEAVYTANT